MKESDQALTGPLHEALDASTENLPPGVATRLAAARAEALEAAADGGWFARWLPAHGGAGWAGAALGGAAVLVLALVLRPDDVAAPAPTVADVPPPAAEAAAAEDPMFDVEDLDMAVELDLMEDLEFVAWLALEDGVPEPVDAG